MRGVGPIARRLGRVNRRGRTADDQATRRGRPDLPDAWPARLGEAIALVEQAFDKTVGLKLYRLEAGPNGAWRMAVIYMAGMVSRDSLEEMVLLPLTSVQWPKPIPDKPDLHYVSRRLLAVESTAQEKDPRKACLNLLRGQALLLIDGATEALVVAKPGYDSRTVDVPEIEPTLRGPREGFVETLDTNLALIRRRLPSLGLRAEERAFGTMAQTKVVVIYLEETCPQSLIDEINRRLNQLDVDLLIDSQPLAESISESRWTPFPLYDQTERPDRAVAALLGGRALLMVDGTPDVLIVPTTFWHLVQTAEDYYSLPTFATFARVMRVLGLLASFFLPSLYVALTTFHQEMVPTPLLLTLAGNRHFVPFPAVFEAAVLELLFEALREAGLRLPRPAGQAISIVGALLLGDAAIRANLVSPMMVIVVAVTGMASFTIPSYELGVAARLFRLALLVFAGSMGLAGLMCAGVFILFHVTSLRSFGMSYFWPVAPNAPDDPGDVVVRPPEPLSRQGPVSGRHSPRPLSRKGRFR